jgi:hypothetical protein
MHCFALPQKICSNPGGALKVSIMLNFNMHDVFFNSLQPFIKIAALHEQNMYENAHSFCCHLHLIHHPSPISWGKHATCGTGGKRVRKS